jgi:HK97 family phage prohead protease
MEKAIKEIRLSEVRTSDKEDEMIIEGYAIVYGKETDMGWYKEVIDRDALNEADISDVCMKYNHEDTFLILARTRNKSLELINDEHGLKVRATLIDTTSNQDVYKSIKAGLLDKMSFAFTVREQKWDYETDVRTITKIDKLYDVSVVDVPAYDSTEIYARNKDNYEKDKKDYIKNKNERKRLELKVNLLSL